MNATTSWDIVIVGSGPAGEAAAMRAAKSGMRVAMVEEQAQVGGNCTHTATIPSKALRHQVRQLVRQHRNPMLRGLNPNAAAGWPDLVERMKIGRASCRER